MIQRLYAQGPNDGLRRQDLAVMTDAERRVAARHAVADDVMGDLPAHLLDGVRVIDGNEQLENVTAKECGQRKQRHDRPSQRSRAQA